jgi:hypothetical protein
VGRARRRHGRVGLTSDGGEDRVRSAETRLAESSRGLTDQEDLVKHGCRGALVGLECCEVHLADESRGPLCGSENVSMRNCQSRDMPCLAEHSLSETRMQTGDHDQVDPPAEDLLEPVPKADVPNEPRNFLELYEQIHVAFWPGVATRD